MSFVSKSGAPSTTKRVQSLTTQFFSQVIRLEQAISNKTYTAETLDELTQFYAQCVEYYDSVQDNIASYFIYKIQDILATKKSLKLLIQENAKALNNSHISELNKSRDQAEESSSGQPGQNSSFLGVNNLNNNSPYKVTVSSPNVSQNHDVIAETVEESSDEDDSPVKFQKRRVTKVPTNPLMRESISTLKNKKQKYFSLELKLQNEKAHAKQSLNDVLESFGGSAQDNDSVVKGDISAQRRRMQEKLARKKKENFANYTQNMTGFLRSENFDDNNKNMESFLKGLDDEESFLPGSNNFEPNAFTNSNVADCSPVRQKTLNAMTQNGENGAFTFSPESKSRVDTENIEGGSDKNQEEGEMIFKEENENEGQEAPQNEETASPALGSETAQTEETVSPALENEGEKGLESAQQQQDEALVEEKKEGVVEELQQEAVGTAVEGQ